MPTNDPTAPRIVAMAPVTIAVAHVTRDGTILPIRNTGRPFTLDPALSSYADVTVGERAYGIAAQAYPDAGPHLTQIRYKNEANGLYAENSVEPAVAQELLRQANAIAQSANVAPSAVSRFQYSMGDALDDGKLNNSVPNATGPRTRER